MNRFLLIMFMTLSIVGCQSLSGHDQKHADAGNSTLTIAVFAEDRDRLPRDLLQTLNVVTINNTNLNPAPIDAVFVSRDALLAPPEQTTVDNRLRDSLSQSKVLLIYNTAPDEAARELGLELSSQVTPQTERYVVGSLAQLSDDTTFGGGVLIPLTASVKNLELAQDIRSHVQEVMNLQHRFSR